MSGERRQRGDPHRPSRGVLTFGVIWLGQLVSLVGSGLTRFGLGVWVYQETGSVTRFALLFAAATLPTVLISPFAGVLVDRWDRRKTMILADCLAAVGTLFIVLLLALDGLEIWHIYIGIGLGAAATAFQWPAYSAATTLLIPKRHLGRAAGMVQFARAGAQMVSPVLAGVMIVTIGIEGILLVDVVTFLFALGTLAVVRVPRPKEGSEDARSGRDVLSEIRSAVRYLRARPGLLQLLGYFTLTNFFGSQAIALSIPLVLAFTDPQVMGTVVSVGTSGMLLGGVVMSAWGGPPRKVYGLLGAGGVFALGIATAGLSPSVVLVGTGLFVFHLAIPVVNGCSQAIWQTKVEPSLQGRVFALRRMFATLSTPLGHIVAGPLADRVFKPLLVEGGPLAASLGGFLGVGPGRGIGLQFVVLGACALGVALVGFTSRRLTRLELDLPDAVDDGEIGATPSEEPETPRSEERRPDDRRRGFRTQNTQA